MHCRCLSPPPRAHPCSTDSAAHVDGVAAVIPSGTGAVLLLREFRKWDGRMQMTPLSTDSVSKCIGFARSGRQ